MPEGPLACSGEDNVVFVGALVEVEGVAERVVAEVAGAAAAVVAPRGHKAGALPRDLQQILRSGPEPRRGGSDQRGRLILGGVSGTDDSAAEAAGEGDRGAEALLDRGRRGIGGESHCRGRRRWRGDRNWGLGRGE